MFRKGMKVLIVCKGDSGIISPFIVDQVNALSKLRISIEYFTIEQKGVLGYLKSLPSLKKRIRELNPNLIHAHYGLSGLLATMQRSCPVVITFHGSDINLRRNRILSFLASRLSIANIYVHPDLPKRIVDRRNVPIIPCGVDLKVFFPIDKLRAREAMGLSQDRKYGLFSSSFTNGVKNYPLAKEALSSIDLSIELIELKGFNRRETNYLMNAVDFLLVTSFSETGPLVVKEAMACNCPIVSTNVGDVNNNSGDLEGHFITNYNAQNVAQNIKKVLTFAESKGKTVGRDRIINLELDAHRIATRILKVYQNVKGY